MFLLYFIAYMSTLTYAPPTKIDSYVNIVHFTIALISPIANLARALFVSMNVFNLACRGRSIASYPGEITLFGGPILYLVLQSVFLLVFYYGGIVDLYGLRFGERNIGLSTLKKQKHKRMKLQLKSGESMLLPMMAFAFFISPRPLGATLRSRT